MRQISISYIRHTIFFFFNRKTWAPSIKKQTEWAPWGGQNKPAFSEEDTCGFQRHQVLLASCHYESPASLPDCCWLRPRRTIQEAEVWGEGGFVSYQVASWHTEERRPGLRNTGQACPCPRPASGGWAARSPLYLPSAPTPPHWWGWRSLVGHLYF